MSLPRYLALSLRSRLRRKHLRLPKMLHRRLRTRTRMVRILRSRPNPRRSTRGRSTVRHGDLGEPPRESVSLGGPPALRVPHPRFQRQVGTALAAVDAPHSTVSVVVVPREGGQGVAEHTGGEADEPRFLPHLHEALAEPFGVEPLRGLGDVAHRSLLGRTFRLSRHTLRRSACIRSMTLTLHSGHTASPGSNT